MIVVSSRKTTIIPRSIFALGKFLVLNNYFGGVNFYTVFVGVAAGLDTSAYYKLGSLVEILFRKFTAFSKSNTIDKVSSLLIVTVVSEISAVNCQCVSRNCQCIFALRISYFRISG